jgi:hypothetical protein
LWRRDEILDLAHKTGQSFGEAGLALGLLSREDMIRVFGPGFEIDFFYLDPRFFPQATAGALTVEEILHFGALPLGFKKKSGFLAKERFLNVGFLDPANKATVSAVEALVAGRLRGENVVGIKIFLLLADQFLNVLREVYGKERSFLQAHDQAALDPALRLLFEP